MRFISSAITANSANAGIGSGCENSPRAKRAAPLLQLAHGPREAPREQGADEDHERERGQRAEDQVATQAGEGVAERGDGDGVADRPAPPAWGKGTAT